ncbi:MAG: methyltransferase, partial [Chloroflexi bacterium]|nr:methyltransferase [Chloroflexota bacterium]
GSEDILQKAQVRVREILSTHYPTYIDSVIDEKIRNRFPILLPREQMRRGNGRW